MEANRWRRGIRGKLAMVVRSSKPSVHHLSNRNSPPSPLPPSTVTKPEAYIEEENEVDKRAESLKFVFIALVLMGPLDALGMELVFPSWAQTKLDFVQQKPFPS
ncbi:uncharacterized protein A4U43_C09F13770 [Asparagus officinalis]|uniref:Uncharacterized protein n=1 Tax=Asparagus officinalis TaxID=4686 RepID=A0A5P1EC62_ASPOF|nr:uncharacterized protein A4U43_C09F13770 [Asparagus officinalis]